MVLKIAKGLVLKYVDSLSDVAPDIADQQVLLFLLLQQTGEVLPHTQCVALQILFLNHV